AATGQHITAAFRQRGNVQHDVDDNIAEVEQPAERGHHRSGSAAPAAAGLLTIAARRVSRAPASSSKPRSLTRVMVWRALSGNAPAPWQGPPMAPATAPGGGPAPPPGAGGPEP